MEAVVVDAGTKLLKAGFAVPDQPPSMARTVGQCGFSCGLFAAIFSFSHCGLERYRRKKNWVNTLTAGAVAGAAFGAGTRNWKQVACFTGLFLSFFQLAKDSTFWIFFADPNGE
ncbi:hypothetical protein ABFS83_07G108000 [Erythranthe nasuta]